tara:strand:- start:195 stop:446 length:252 start_codon:yes stop_codon:yes gene_type:complete
MKYFSGESPLINLWYLLILIFSVNFLIFFNLGCGTSLNQKNYNKCIEGLEEERQKIRVGKRFSYKARSFEECRAPARYRLDSD